MMEEIFKDGGWTLIRESASLPDGREKTVVRVSHADSVHILAFDKEGNILTLREFRPFYQTWVWMLPSGRVDKEKDHKTAALRELREETGHTAKSLTFLWKGNISERLKMTNHYYLAKELSHSPLQQDPEELIEVHHLKPEKALENILHSPNVHIPSAYGLLRWTHENP